MHWRTSVPDQGRTRVRRRAAASRLRVERLEARELLSASPSQTFVAQTYRDLLHREADAGGLAGFTAILEQGAATRPQVALAILGSPEYQADAIQALYNLYLHRSADPTGLAAFSSFLAAGGTPDAVAAMLAGSPEYAQLHGGSDTGFLAAFYQDALGRLLDAGGRGTFTRSLTAGANHTAVAFAVFATPEYLQGEVQGFYQQVLHRPADPTGLAAFSTVLGAGARPEVVIATLLSSNEYAPPDDAANRAAAAAGDPALTAGEVQALLQRAAAASASNDAIIAVVDRGGRVLGVRVEAGVSPGLLNDPVLKTFAVDGALAEARTGAFFGNDQAPLTSRTIRFISQSTITQREVQSIPDIADPNSPLRGPGFVAPIGLGAHFPPGIPFTPMVDLFEIEHTNRDSILHPGADGNKTPTDYIQLPNRFNVSNQYVPAGDQMQPPESYGLVSGIDPFAQSRGIGTLPGGIPIIKAGHVVGGIGVFFPGATGFATEENSALDATYNPAKRDRSLEAEYMAFAALGGSSAAGVRIGTLGGVPPLPGFDLPFGRIDLVGVQLDIFGPGGTQGVYTLAQFGSALGTRAPAGDTDLPVDLNGDPYVNGSEVPTGWLVTPHDGGGITAADVVRIITQGINQANQTRAAIRLPLGSTARMVFSVSDKEGNLLGLYRMPDATIFSIDVAVAKSRNTAYYANPAQLQVIDQTPGVPPGAALSSRTFRYLAGPRFPEGIDGSPAGPFSALNDGGTNPLTGLQVGAPLPAAAFQSVEGHDAFFPGTNFHDPYNTANQNGIVFFPGGVPLYKAGTLVGGLGVSGDGVDQDDVVTFAASQGYTPPPNAPTADNFFVRGVRLPYQKFDRNPEG